METPAFIFAISRVDAAIGTCERRPAGRALYWRGTKVLSDIHAWTGFFIRHAKLPDKTGYKSNA